MIRRIYRQEELVAIIIDFSCQMTSTTFFTEHAIPLQVGIILKDSDEPVYPHRHNVFERSVKGTTEFLFVLEGSMTLTIFDKDFKNPEHFDVGEGFGVLLLDGAHAIDFKKSTKLIEVKQGPYAAQNDKVYLKDLTT